MRPQLDDQTHPFYVHSINISEMVCGSLSRTCVFVVENLTQCHQLDFDGANSGKPTAPNGVWTVGFEEQQNVPLRLIIIHVNGDHSLSSLWKESMAAKEAGRRPLLDADGPFDT